MIGHRNRTKIKIKKWFSGIPGMTKTHYMNSTADWRSRGKNPWTSRCIKRNYLVKQQKGNKRKRIMSSKTCGTIQEICICVDGIQEGQMREKKAEK